MEAIRSFFRMLSDIEAAERARQGQEGRRPVYRLFRQYVLVRHMPTLVMVVVLASLAGQVMYGYAIAGRFIADHIVEIGLTDESPGVVADGLDPTLNGENRLFTFDQPHHRDSWSQRLETRPGKTTPQKLKLLAGWRWLCC